MHATLLINTFNKLNLISDQVFTKLRIANMRDGEDKLVILTRKAFALNQKLLKAMVIELRLQANASDESHYCLVHFLPPNP